MNKNYMLIGLLILSLFVFLYYNYNKDKYEGRVVGVAANFLGTTTIRTDQNAFFLINGNQVSHFSKGDKLYHRIVNKDDCIYVSYFNRFLVVKAWNE